MTRIKTSTQVKKVLDLPGGEVEIGPGSVPTSSSSVRTTSMKEVAKKMRSASKAALFGKTDTYCFCD